MGINPFKRRRGKGKGERNAKLPSITDLVTEQTEKKLGNICDEVIKEVDKSTTHEDKNLIGQFDGEYIDLLSGQPFDYPKSKIPVKKEVGKSGKKVEKVGGAPSGKRVEKVEVVPKKAGFYKQPSTFNKQPFLPKPIEADVTVACIELTDSIEKISKWIDASLKFYSTKFYKFIFFNNKVYSTEMKLKSCISKKEILEMIRIQKEIASTLPKENTLLYDAVDEAFYLSKEYDFFEKRKITVEKTDFKITNIKYLFVISGEEKGSDITKEELQQMISNVRTKETDIHVVLTNTANIGKILPLGFRSIKTY